MNRLVAQSLALVVLSASVLQAQDQGFWSRIETGVTASAASNLNSSIGPRSVTPWSIRVAYVSPTSPWGVEGETEFNAARMVDGRQYTEFGTPISLVRRIGRGRGAKGIAGLYASIGFSSRYVAARPDTTGASMSGVVAGVGSRLTIGKSVSIRPEYVVMRDRSRTRDGVLYPGVSRSMFRLGVGVFYPEYW